MRLRAGAVAVATGALTAACAGAANTMTLGPPAAPAASMTPVQGRPASELERFYRQRLAWSDCKDGFQCATLKVPRDYAKPSGPEFGIAVIRLAASDPSRRIGSLVTNPGGPGESGVTFIHMNGRSFGDALRARFDLVGFDPRGVGRSDPVHCSASPEVVHRIYADPPQTPTEISAQVATVKTYVAGCEARSGAELPYVGTVSAARDMDVLRAVLGDQRLTYLGFSYGTYLGATYAGLFPTHVRALALDGAEDPKKTAAQEDLEQARGFETALRSFAADCVKTPGCPLGDASVDAALAKVTELQEQARRRPLTNRAGNHRPVDEDGVTEGITAALYSRDTWPGLRLAFAQALKNGDGTAFVALAGALGPVSAARDVDESEGALFAVDCVDRPYPATVEAIRAEAAEAKKIAPHFGASIVWPSLVCSFWPVKNTRQPTPVRAAGAPPILVVGTTRDPATPYGWAQGLAAELTSGVLLTYNGDGHTAFLQGNACIDDAVENYLIDLRVPEPGTVCEQQVPETGEQAKSHPS